MRLVLATAALVLAAGAFAQSVQRPLPPGTRPLEEPPAPPAVTESDPALEPQVTIRREGDRSIAEYRIRGRLYMIKVTPAHGRPYVLIDNRGDGQFSRHDGLDSGLRVPQWVLLEF